MIDIKFDENKFRNLVLYIANRCEDDPNFGITKLNKILFFSDFFAYAELGQPITGATYVALTYGPMLDNMKFLTESMENEGYIKLRKKERFGNLQHRIISLSETVDLSDFSAEEIAFVNEIIDRFSDANAHDLSELTHGWNLWQIAGQGEKIPYQAIFISEAQATKADYDRARELTLRYEW